MKRVTVKLRPHVVALLRQACARRTAEDGERWTFDQLLDEALLALAISDADDRVRVKVPDRGTPLNRP